MRRRNQQLEENGLLNKESEADQVMYEQLPKGKQKPLVEEESNFLDWALIKVPQGELRMNYYKLLKQYRKENVKLVKN
jgi:hypothetical protein